ncbi:unnamed protein product [Bursaphelenchus xylophilus]|uniref:Histone-lysine N-methyltransferase, H3 lysine-79 specific n=1 Tax=Bursaphelenchus xylophilus TaxID=6326 RepID=A0A1I7S7I2_BURXY|nr:unnamed protein product [Bursaphelenchus xylophilus]CAG9085126.1 unnamed protein product [Bursaphelenchus xylophilus]
MSSDDTRDSSPSDSKSKSESSSNSAASYASSESSEKCRTLTINSPAAGDPLIFQFKPPNAEFVDILKLSIDEFEGLKQVVTMCVGSLDNLYTADYEALDDVCSRFNRAASTISNLWKGATKPGSNSEFASTKLLSRILTHSYNKAVDNEKALNKHYEAFSSETYGETSFNRMQMIIDELKPTNQDVFVDLGSGVGQLVAHMAGGSRVKKAFGIEIAQLPAKFAARLEEEFRKLMKFFGKKVRPFSLERGNFLDENYRELITQDATIIFINNYAFQSDLEAKIKQNLLSELKNGTKIISTKPYGALNKNITERQLNDISSILDVVELKRCPNPCSWTSNDVPYYLHVVNHEKLEKYFLGLRNSSLKSDLRRSATPSSKNSDSRESSVPRRILKKKIKDGDIYGPTTRRKWQAYVSEGAPNEKDESPHKNGDTPSDEKISNSNDSDSDFEEKKKKRTASGKPKGRPRKLNEKKEHNPFSNDAEEGMELMHRMICEAAGGRRSQAGHNANDAKASKKFKIAKKMETGKLRPEITLPFPTVNNPSKKSSKISNTGEYKYPNLEVFLSELRRVYESFLDNVKPNDLNSNKTLTVPKVSNNKLGHYLVDITHRMDKIRAKYIELGTEVDSLRDDVITLVSKFSNADMPNSVSSTLNGELRSTPSTSGSQVGKLANTSVSSDGERVSNCSVKLGTNINGQISLSSASNEVGLINTLTSLIHPTLGDTPPIDLNVLNHISSASPAELSQMVTDISQRNQMIYSLLANTNPLSFPSSNVLLALRNVTGGSGVPQGSFDNFTHYSSIPDSRESLLPHDTQSYVNPNDPNKRVDQRVLTKRPTDGVHDEVTSPKRFGQNSA